MDLRGLSSVTDFFLVCTVGSARQVGALAEHITAVLTQQGTAVWHTEGMGRAPASSRPASESPQWALMDCGEVVVHLMDQAARDFYRLEDLWGDAPRLSLSACA